MKELFRKFSTKTACAMGSSWAFIVAILAIVIWAISGPIFGFSDTWQLLINTGTTLVTFLMVFLIQASQNRDTQALQLKLDELIRASSDARNTLLNIEDMSEEDLTQQKQAFVKEAQRSKPASSPALNSEVSAGHTQS